jgi:hypothetical protein
MTQPGEDLHELDAPILDPDRRDPEAPDADAYEQALPADPTAVHSETRVPLEADEADALEQAQVVEGLDDDYRE